MLSLRQDRLLLSEVSSQPLACDATSPARPAIDRTAPTPPRRAWRRAVGTSPDGSSLFFRLPLRFVFVVVIKSADNSRRAIAIRSSCPVWQSRISGSLHSPFSVDDHRAPFGHGPRLGCGGFHRYYFWSAYTMSAPRLKHNQPTPRSVRNWFFGLVWTHHPVAGLSHHRLLSARQTARTPPVDSPFRHPGALSSYCSGSPRATLASHPLRRGRWRFWPRVSPA